MVGKNKNLSIGRWLIYGCISLFSMMSACKKKDSCNVPCYGGTCVDNSCNCNLGYEGDSCSVLTSHKFIGNWNAIDSCELNTYGYTATIAASSVLNQLVITNFGEYGTSFTVRADVSGMTFTVPEQIVEGITLSGSGIIDTVTKKITVSFEVRDEFYQTDACKGVWTKQ